MNEQDQATREAGGKGASQGGGTMNGGARDDLEGGTSGTTSMTGSDPAATRQGAPNEASPIGKASPAGNDMGPTGMESARSGPDGPSGGGVPLGPAGHGAFGSSTYNSRGNVNGPESPAGAEAMPPEGNAQGDDLANRLGGGAQTGTGLSGSGAATGAMEADRSEGTGGSAPGAVGAGGTDAGSPGGMGGARAQGGTGAGRPSGGVSPVQKDQD